MLSKWCTLNKVVIVIECEILMNKMRNENNLFLCISCFSCKKIQLWYNTFLSCVIFYFWCLNFTLQATLKFPHVLAKKYIWTCAMSASVSANFRSLDFGLSKLTIFVSYLSHFCLLSRLKNCQKEPSGLNSITTSSIFFLPSHHYLNALVITILPITLRMECNRFKVLGTLLHQDHLFWLWSTWYFLNCHYVLLSFMVSMSS